MTPRGRRLRTLAAGITAAIAVSYGAIVTPRYQLRYNASHSAPLGWYAIVPAHEVSVGAFALARLPPAAEILADRRHYLPRGVPLLKRVAATHGQLVCSCKSGFQIDGVVLARALTRDSLGRPLAAWTDCRRLTQEEIFLLNSDNPASFDSRYFGPVTRTAVIGKAIPLWTW